MPTPKKPTAKKSTSKKTNNKKKTNIKLQVPYTWKPENMTDNEWQTALRKQIAAKQTFVITNVGSEPVYSDYSIVSPHSKNTYKVALRSKDNSHNYCSCPDFKINQLSTCKHIEAVRIYLGKKRGIKKLMDIIPILPYSSVYVSYARERKVKLRIGSDNKKEFEKWSKNYFDTTYTLLPGAYLSIDKLLQEASAINSTFRCYEDALELILQYRVKTKRITLLEQHGLTLLDGLTNATLFPYQQEGILYAVKAGRAILADDMGLGKTLQAILWATLMQKYFNTEKALIVCPTSLKYQWKTEIEKFTGSSVTVIEGNALARKALYEKDDNYFKIVSYHMAGNDWAYINRMQPDIIILDEAQRIKNWKTKISQNIKRLRSFYALILTGTPLENNIEELYSLVQFINPYLLGSLHHFLSAHQVKDGITGKITGYQGLNEIGKKLSTILIRRTKQEVLKQLPGRMDKNLFVPLTKEQRELHTEYKDVVARLVNKWRKFGFLSEQDRQRLLINLNLMRMVCDTTYIIDQSTNFQTKLDELFNILDELFNMEGEKVVIFSQWERMTRLIAMGLTDRNVKFEYLHGGVPSKKRESLFKNFNADPECKVFLSTDAGGVGLNLQAASHLINMDIPWNPAVLEQRIARIYRMGQKKNVSITNIIAEATIEHEMLAKLRFKSSLAEGILDNGEDSIFMDEDRFKKFIESIESITGEVTEPTTDYDTDEKEEVAAVKTAAESEDDSSFVIDEEELEEQEQQILEESENVKSSAASLVENGVSFFTQLMNTLQDEKAVKELADTLTEKDEKTGQLYLKLPVNNKDTVTQALNLFAGLMKGLGK